MAVLALVAAIWIFVTHHTLTESLQAQADAESRADAAEAAYQQVQADQEIVDTTEGSWSLHTKSAFSSSDAWSAIQTAVKTFCSQDGYTCGIVMQDLTSGESISYNADEFFYPASSIKALYLCALFEEEVETDQVSLSAVRSAAQSIIIYSDNDAYNSLWQSYGSDCFVAWAQEAGVNDEFLENAAIHTYPRLSASDMALLWRHAYDYLSSDSEAAQVLASYLDEPETTVIGTIAEKSGRNSWSKAGWFPDSEGNASPTTADCGIIFNEQGPYLICVLSTAPQDFDALGDLMEVLDAQESALS